MTQIKKKPLKFEPKSAGKTKILTTKAALKAFVADECNVSVAVGQMVEHFAPKMAMMNRVLSPEEDMEPCLMNFWTLLDRVCEKIEGGEWK